MEELNTSMEALISEKPLVGLWMNWMGIIMLVSILFVWKHVAARYVLAAMILLFPAALIIYKMTGNIHLIGIAHLIFWIPLAYYLIKHEAACSNGKWKTPYGFWLVLVVLTILISLVFDIRDIILVMFDKK